MGIKENLTALKQEIPAHVKLVAVSKTKPPGDIMEAYAEGHRLFGENKAQEMVSKQPQLPGDIRWHFIGHLQTNKVKFLVPFVEMIESVDRFKLLKEIDMQARKVDRRIDCLLQFHIAEEETKFGLDMPEAKALLEDPLFAGMKHIRICGVMGMATFTDNMEQVRREFKSLKMIFEQIKQNYFPDDPAFKEISMGMSGDYRIAIEEGSTIVRVGSLIFGERNY
ncbi:MAG: YggS family pyridoxal phosphate-dependent enzyme [Bacteroidales bacterium]